jgi:hypothetical protein
MEASFQPPYLATGEKSSGNHCTGGWEGSMLVWTRRNWGKFESAVNPVRPLCWARPTHRNVFYWIFYVWALHCFILQLFSFPSFKLYEAPVNIGQTTQLPRRTCPYLVQQHILWHATSVLRRRKAFTLTVGVAVVVGTCGPCQNYKALTLHAVAF